MANITGTNGNDTLIGTAEDDTIQGLNGNDIIFSSSGNDTIDGGTGNDTVDYTNSSNPLLRNLLDINPRNSVQSLKFSRIGFNGSSDNLIDIETIIGSNVVSNNFIGLNTDGSADIDLSKNRVTYSSSSFGTKTLTVKNFNDIIGTIDGSVRVKGNDLDNSISIASFGSSEKIIIGSKGNDNLSARENSTVDYSNIGQTISLNVTDERLRDTSIATSLSIDKNGFGIDKISFFEKIIGTNNKENTIEASNVAFSTKLDVNLKNNSLNITIPGNSMFNDRIKYEVINFVNVTGGRNDDTIVGANKNGKLTGGGGNDTITGGNRNDRITGTDSTARGVGEVDILTGGGGRDKFVLGDANGAYYVGKGKDDYATITDFNLFQDSIDLGGLKNYSFGFGGNNSIELYSGKDVNTRDRIAKIQLTGGFSNRATNSRSMMGANSNIDAIVGNIDILSGDNINA